MPCGQFPSVRVCLGDMVWAFTGKGCMGEYTVGEGVVMWEARMVGSQKQVDVLLYEGSGVWWCAVSDPRLGLRSPPTNIVEAAEFACLLAASELRERGYVLYRTEKPFPSGNEP